MGASEESTGVAKEHKVSEKSPHAFCATNEEFVLEMRDIHKIYDVIPPVKVLKGIDVTIRAGERIAIVGESGAGKSTLLNIMGLLDLPTSGTYKLLGRETEGLKPRTRDRMRSQILGFVFQDFHVLGHRTIEENLDLKLSINKVARHKRPHLIEEVLGDVGLSGRRFSLARLLSGGEKQRLAIARAIINRPQILLADEPTGNLDSSNAEAVLDLFDAQAARGVAVVVITHDTRLAQWADRVLILREGRIVT